MIGRLGSRRINVRLVCMLSPEIGLDASDFIIYFANLLTLLLCMRAKSTNNNNNRFKQFVVTWKNYMANNAVETWRKTNFSPSANTLFMAIQLHFMARKKYKFAQEEALFCFSKARYIECCLFVWLLFAAYNRAMAPFMASEPLVTARMPPMIAQHLNSSTHKNDTGQQTIQTTI